MPSMIVGSYAMVEGPRGGVYTIRHPTPDVYTCDCPQYRSLHTVPSAARTCRHILEYVGMDELDRVSLTPLQPAALATLLQAIPSGFRGPLRTLVHSRHTAIYPIPQWRRNFAVSPIELADRLFDVNPDVLQSIPPGQTVEEFWKQATQKQELPTEPLPLSHWERLLGED